MGGVVVVVVAAVAVRVEVDVAVEFVVDLRVEVDVAIRVVVVLGVEVGVEVAFEVDLRVEVDVAVEFVVVLGVEVGVVVAFDVEVRVVPFARASSLPRLMRCVGQSILVEAPLPRSDRTLEACEWGSIAHRWMETGSIEASSEKYQHLADHFLKKLKLCGANRRELWPEDAQFEIAVGIDPGNGTAELYTGDDRDLWKLARPDTECTGSIDATWYIFDTLYICDLKTGRFADIASHYEQLMAYALGLCRALDYKDDCVIAVDHWPRYPRDGLPRREIKRVSPDEINEFETQLLKTRDRILRAKEDRTKLELITGEHCQWCEARIVCPELNKEIKR